MDLIKLSIVRPVFAWMLMAGLIVFGAIALLRLGVSQMPDVDFPVLTISVNYEGAAPEIIEAEIIDTIEQKLLSVEGIKEMRSTARQGAGSIKLEFDIERNIDVALQEVQSILTDVRLPLGVDPPTVAKTNPEEQPIMSLGVAGERDLRNLLNWTDTYLLDQLRFIKGIGDVSIGGFSSRNFRIWPDPQKLAKAQLTVLDLVDAVTLQHVESSAGNIVTAGKEQRLRWRGEVTTVEEMENLPILRRGNQLIRDAHYRIKDVASVEDGLSDVRRIARIDGKNAVGIAIRKQRGSNELALAQLVRQKVADLGRRFQQISNCRSMLILPSQPAPLPQRRMKN